MDENKLQSFLTVCKTGSFTKAADILYLSPVAVKNQIDALEAEFGEKLFVRKPTGCVLTDVGVVFRKHAEIILNAMTTAKAEVERAGIHARGEIIMGHNITFNYKFAGSLSVGFTSVRADHIIQFQKYPKDELIDLLIKRRINCVMAESTLIDDADKLGLEFYPFASLPVYALMKKDHLLSSNEYLTIDMLAGQEIYVSSTLGKQTLSQIEQVSPGKVKLIEDTDRNILFNRVVKNAVQVYPRRFTYYSSIPLQSEQVIIGLFVLKNQPKIMKDMISYVQNFAKNLGAELEEIM